MKNYFGKKTLAGRLLSSTTDLKKIVPLNVDEKGARVMEYTLGKVIGFGAWGTIRECFDNNQNPYAMKIVSNKKMSVINLFKREIMIWEQLNHPKILKLFKYLETEDSIFCLMDRIKGGTLFELVSKWGVIEGN
ncbi:kinase-like protein, partial [Yamadazyma tenuis ATCC 10573]